jgi:hypothetical protein
MSVMMLRAATALVRRTELYARKRLNPGRSGVGTKRPMLHQPGAHRGRAAFGACEDRDAVSQPPHRALSSGLGVVAPPARQALPHLRTRLLRHEKEQLTHGLNSYYFLDFQI